MNMTNFLHGGLLIHLIGLALLVGATLSNYIVTKQFRKEKKDQQTGLALVQSSIKLWHLSVIGLVLQVASGAMMLAATGGGYGQQLWFKIKMALVLLILASTIARIRSLQNQLQQLVLAGESNAHKKTANRKNCMEVKLPPAFPFRLFYDHFHFKRVQIYLIKCSQRSTDERYSLRSCAIFT